MEPLTFNDTQILLKGIQELYSLRNLDTFGIDLLTIVNRLVQSEIPEFHITCLQSRQTSRAFLANFPGLTCEMEQVIVQHFNEHPIARNLPQTLQSAHKISDFINQKQLHQLEGLYQQFLRLINIADGMTLLLSPNKALPRHQLIQTNVLLVGISLYRDRCSFTDRDRLMLNLLRPHLVQAYGNAQHYQQLQQNFTQLQQSLEHLGLIILCGAGQVQLITPQAAKYLEIYFSQQTTSAQLPEHLQSWVRHQVARLTNPQLPQNPGLPFCVEQVGRRLTIRLVIEQVEARYLLLLEEHTAFSFDLLELLGLSPREAEVLFWMIRGKDNQVIADQLNLHLCTVRKHLENIYRKLNVHSRAEAIAHAVEKLGFLDSSALI